MIFGNIITVLCVPGTFVFIVVLKEVLRIDYYSIVSAYKILVLGQPYTEHYQGLQGDILSEVPGVENFFLCICVHLCPANLDVGSCYTLKFVY